MATLLWFQRDLRTQDNPALNWALRQDTPVIAIYIYSPEEDAPWSEGAASRWWLHHSLEKLETDLLALGITLQFFHAHSINLIPQLVNDYDVTSVAWINRHEPHRRKIESNLEKILINNEKIVQRFTDELLSRPDEFLTQSKQTPYKVFTPFYRRLRQGMTFYNINKNEIAADISALMLPFQHVRAISLQQLQLLGDHCWHNKLHQHWSPGQMSAQDKLDKFISETLNHYSSQRDFPAIEGTSALSPHLHFGEISPRQIVTALAPLIEFHGGNIATEAEAFLRQLIWREFARYILRHFPETTSKPMNKKFSDKFWKKDKASLTKWQEGNTGIPIIDAGMKQLWNTGSMHNRVRMLVASFLTKNLGINWQEGANWFWDTLVDADLANNSMGWQWVAGCGVDAAPYFRIFNPLTQAKRFDENHHYIDRWIEKDITLNYPAPIIDLAESRNSSLLRYKQYITAEVK